MRSFTKRKKGGNMEECFNKNTVMKVEGRELKCINSLKQKVEENQRDEL